MATKAVAKNGLPVTDYREILLQQLSRRQADNPRYGLRAFSRDLGISPSQLSEVLRGVHGLSPARAVDVGIRLGFSEREQRLFCDLVTVETGRSSVTRDAARTRLNGASADLKKHVFDEDSFRLVADWYHLAILALAETKKFSTDLSAIAKRLDVPVHQTEMAVKRLIRLGLLTKNNGKLELVASQTSTTDDVPSEAIRIFHTQVFNKARQALLTHPPEERQISSMVFAMRKTDLPAAKERLKAFRRKFMAEFERTDATGDEVFCLNMSLFGLSQ